jgi:lysophospholipase L1-like esterase
MTKLRWLPLVALLLALPAARGSAAETNSSFAKWEKEIAAFERSDATNPPPKGALLFIGSSGIRLWHTLATDFPGHQVINRGFGGSEIADSTHFADRIIFPYAPRAIFFRAGGNDLANGKFPEQVFADFKAFVTTVHARLPEADITFISWNPTIARWSQREQEKTLNTLVREFISQQPRLHYIEIAPSVLGPDGQPRAELLAEDKLHFSEAGYRMLADLVRPHLPPAKTSR